MDGWLVWDGEAVAEVIPERHAKLGGRYHPPKECIAAVTTIDTAGSAADLSFGDDCPFIPPMSGRSWKSTIHPRFRCC
jgi:hypothetical protein